LLTRQWRHIDLVNGWLRLDPNESKNREARMFPLTPALGVVLKGQRERARAIERSAGTIIPWMFVRPDGRPIQDFRWIWARACRQADIRSRLVHDFRPTAVRNLERAGVPRSAARR
jgi:integrase